MIDVRFCSLKIVDNLVPKVELKYLSLIFLNTAVKYFMVIF